MSYFWEIYALKNENSLDFLVPLEKFFSVPLLQRDFVSRCSLHASGTAQSCIKTKGQRDKNSLDLLFPLERLFSVSIIMPSLRDYYAGENRNPPKKWAWENHNSPHIRTGFNDLKDTQEKWPMFGHAGPPLLYSTIPFFYQRLHLFMS